jgi:hypothetical protein
MAGARAGRARLRALAQSAVGPPIGLALLTLAAFAPVFGNGFIWDDQFNFVDNPHVRGLGSSELRWMLTTAASTHPGWGGQWIPLTWLTVALDYRVWGLNPSDPALRYDRGLAPLGVGQPEPALGEFRLAVRLDPSNAEAPANLAALVRDHAGRRP